MKVLITGANGMVARAAAKYCLSIGDTVIGATRQQLDIADRPAVLKLFEDERPDAVLNCAAYTNVDGAESEPDASRAANTIGVENLALASRLFDCRFLTISTDYVFGGGNRGFYTQRDTPDPISVYGRTKLDGELAARSAYGRSIIVRSGWIFGEGGTNFLSVLPRLISEGRELTAISDAFGTPTYAGDLAKRMRELIELDLPCIFHVTNAGDGTTYFGFAREICRSAGFDESSVTAVTKDSLYRPAPRPVSSKLACLFSERFGLRPLRPWTEALAEFIAAR